LQDDGQGTLIGVDAASVYLMEPGATDPDLALRSTASEPDGSFALLGVLPGTYDVIATWDELEGSVPGVEVAQGALTHIELVVE